MMYCLQVFEGIRDYIVQSVELKFNCFFLMPLIDTFPQVRRIPHACADHKPHSTDCSTTDAHALAHQQLEQCQVHCQALVINTFTRTTWFQTDSSLLHVVMQQRLREQLEEAWESDIEDVFDVKAVRTALEFRLKNLEAEKQQVGLLV